MVILFFAFATQIVWHMDLFARYCLSPPCLPHIAWNNTWYKGGTQHRKNIAPSDAHARIL